MTTTAPTSGGYGQYVIPLLSGLLGASSSKKGTTETAEKKMDPRMDRFVYGDDGASGLLGSAYGLMQQQMATGGLNDMQRQGMDMQRQFLMSPQYQQGYGNMMGLGQSLMGGGIAGNPFTQNGTAGNSFSSVASSSMSAPQPFQYSGSMGAGLPDYSKSAPQMTSANSPASQLAQLLQGGDPYWDDAGRGGDVGDAPANSATGNFGIADLAGMLGVTGPGQGALAGLSAFGVPGAVLGGLLGLAANKGGGNSSSVDGGYNGASDDSGAATGGTAADGFGVGSVGGSGEGEASDGLGWAKGGRVTKDRLIGPKPAGEDDGYGALAHGEFVIKADTAKRIGAKALKALNDGRARIVMN